MWKNSLENPTRMKMQKNIVFDNLNLHTIIIIIIIISAQFFIKIHTYFLSYMNKNKKLEARPRSSTEMCNPVMLNDK
jgi:hypothetical protein